MAPLSYISEILAEVHTLADYFRTILDRTSVGSLTVAAMALNTRDIASCPGYTLSGISQTQNSITANLQLASAACNAYGTDLDSLQLLVEYQTGENNLVLTI